MKRKPSKYVTTRWIMKRVKMKTISGVIKFLKREGLAEKKAGRYKISRARLMAHYPEILENGD